MKIADARFKKTESEKDILRKAETIYINTEGFISSKR